MTSKNKGDKKEIDTTKAMAKKANVMTADGKIIITLKDDREVQLYKCKAKNVGRVMDFIAFIMEEMNIDSIGDMPKDVDFTNPKLLLPLLTKSASRIIYLSAALCSLDNEEVEDLELDDMIDLVSAQFEVNKDFFLQNVLPRVGLSQTE